ncbi:MAG: prepilin-type N-terminal cleavage/methylation domain-containing protein [Patescibacteria group bacterium]
MHSWALKQKNNSGFTIVELLIVVVVIAILAAITIVAYNGIQNRAKASAAQSIASQAAKRLATLALTAGDAYPQDEAAFLAAVGLNEDGATTYQYSSSSPFTSYCLTSTTNKLSYVVTSTNQTPIAGACPGHDLNGIQPITNLLANTSVELDQNGLQNIGSTGDRSINRVPVGDAKAGSYVLRLVVGVSGGVAGYGSMSGTIPPGRYTGSVWIRSNVALAINPYFEGTSVRTAISQQGATLVPGAWTRLWKTVDVTTAGTIKVGFLGGGAGTTAQNNYVEVDGFMLTSGDTVYEFADGSTSNWVWTGTPNASTSFGQAL